MAACFWQCAARTSASRESAAARWWKGNTHTHTLWSDGDAAPEIAALWYREHGYHFLVLSDHNVLSRGERWFEVKEGTAARLNPQRVNEIRSRFGDGWLVEREVEGRPQMRLKTLEELRHEFEEVDAFLLIEGEEITSDFEKKPVHVNGLNLAEPVPPQTGASVREVMQKAIDAVIDQGTRFSRPVLAHLNHPNFHYAVSVDDVAAIDGEHFFEVYNGHGRVENYGDASHLSTEAMWDQALALRLREGRPILFGLATDDAHNYFTMITGHSNPGRGWIMVRAAELTAAAILAAMHAGDFYASSGVSIEDLRADGNGLVVAIDSEEGVSYVTRFIGTRADGAPGQALLETLENPARYSFRGDEVYVRATVVSTRPHPNPYRKGDFECAWVQPVLGPAARSGGPFANQSGASHRTPKGQ